MTHSDVDKVYQMLRDFRKTLVDAGVSNHTVNEYTLFITKTCNTLMKEMENASD